MSHLSQSYTHQSRRLVASNSRFQIFFDCISTPTGDTIPDYLVVSPNVHVADNIVGVCILPYYVGKFWLMKGWRHHCDSFIWQAPAGFVEHGESPAESAARELYEESGFLALPSSLTSLGSFLPDAGLIDGRVALFLSNCNTRTDTDIPFEIGLGKLTALSKEDLSNLILHSSNIGASTLVACFRSLAFLHTI